MSDLSPVGPFEPPAPEIDPLSPPWADMIDRSADALVDAQSHLESQINSRLATGRAAVAQSQVALGGEITSKLNAAREPVDQALQQVDQAVQDKVSNAFGYVDDPAFPGLSVRQVQADITGYPVAGIDWPGNDPLAQRQAPPPPGPGAPAWQVNGDYTITPDGNLIPNGVRPGIDYYDPPIFAPPGFPGQPVPPPSPGGPTVPPPGWPVPPGPAVPPPIPIPPPAIPPPSGNPGTPPCDTPIVPPDGWPPFVPIDPYPCTCGPNECHTLLQGGRVSWYRNDTGQLCLPGQPYAPPPPPAPTPPAPAPKPTDPVDCLCAILDRLVAVPEAKVAQYKVWSGSEGCYLADLASPPKSTADRLLAQGVPQTSWLALVVDACQTAPKPEQPVAAELDQGRLDGACVDIPPGFTWGRLSIAEGLTWLLTLDQKSPPPGVLSQWVQRITGVPDFNAALREGLRRIIRGVLGPIDTLVGGGACGGESATAANIQLFLLDFIQKWVGSPPPAMTRPLQQQRDYLCPTELPSPSEATMAWLGATASDSDWECWTRAAGVLPAEAAKIREAGRAKLTAGELAALYHREQITASEFSQRLRESGWIKPNDPMEIDRLSEQIPVLSDLLRFMVRDAGDDALAQKFGMDSEFEQKWSGQLAKFATWQNIHPDYAKLAWRSHWDIPPLTQLTEMYHRLRHDWVPEADRVSLDDVETALKQDDKLPYWIPKLLAISFARLGRIDIRRAYQIGVLDREKMRRKILESGYSPEDAETLTEFTVRTIDEQVANSSVVTKYGNYKVSREEMRRRLELSGAADSAIREAETRGDLLRRRFVRGRCQAALKRRYLTFELGIGDVRSQLVQDGTDSEEITDLVEAWQCERSARGKVLPAAAAVRLYERGLLSVTDLYSRYLRIGYSTGDAAMLVREAVDRNGEKITAKQERSMATAQRERDRDDRRQRQLEQQAIRDAKAGETANMRLAKQLQEAADRADRARRDAAKLEEQRADQIMKAAVTVANRSGEALATVYHGMRRLVYTSVPALWLDMTAAVDAATVASKSNDATSLDAWEIVWRGAATGTQSPIPEAADQPVPA